MWRALARLSLCSAQEEAYGNPPENVEMQLPESSRTQLTKLAEASQREVGAGLGLRLSWLPQFPEQMQMSVPSA